MARSSERMVNEAAQASWAAMARSAFLTGGATEASTLRVSGARCAKSGVHPRCSRRSFCIVFAMPVKRHDLWCGALRMGIEPGRVSRRLRIEDDLSSGQENLRECHDPRSIQMS